MNVKQLLDYHGGDIKRAAKAHDVTIDAIYKWRRENKISHARQCQIEVETGYDLLSDYTERRLANTSSTECGNE